MSGVPHRRGMRLTMLLVLIFAASVLSSCATRRYAHWQTLLNYPDPDPSPCHAEPGSDVPKPGNSKAPVVCIDDRDMSGPITVPPVVTLNNAVINWFTVSGKGSISLVFEDPSPVKHLVCGENRAFCQAVIEAKVTTRTAYHYSVLVQSGGRKQTIDPTIQVDPGMVVWQEQYK